MMLLVVGPKMISIGKQLLTCFPLRVTLDSDSRKINTHYVAVDVCGQWGQDRSFNTDVREVPPPFAYPSK